MLSFYDRTWFVLPTAKSWDHITGEQLTEGFVALCKGRLLRVVPPFSLGQPVASPAAIALL